MRDLYERNGLVDDARGAVERYIALAAKDVEALPAAEGRAALIDFARMLLERNS